MASQISEREDSVLCSDVRDKLFGPMEFSRRDLGALNIMRGRDNGLPDYNTVRAYFKLPKIKEWNDINPGLFAKQPELLRLLVASYSNRLDNVDVYVGGMLESLGSPGELFTNVIKEQFARIRDSDRFWFENTDNGYVFYFFFLSRINYEYIPCRIFTEEEVAEIKKVRLWDIIVNSTDVEPGDLQVDVFQFKEGDPCPQPVQLNTTLLEPCKYLKGYDYFEVSIF